MVRIAALRRWLARQPNWLVDGALALLVFVLEAMVLVLVDPAQLQQTYRGYTGPTPAAFLWAFLTAVPLVWRRRAPLPVAGVALATLLATTALQVPVNGYGAVVALYSVAAYLPRSLSLPALWAFVLGVTAWAVLVGWLQYLIFAWLSFAGVWLLGAWRQQVRAYTRQLEQRAALLERERDTQAALAAARERQRIARELHDVLAHSVSVMVVQATAAARTLRSKPDLAEQALQQVTATGRSSLVELRRLLGLLRESDDEALLAPQPGLLELEDLVAQFRAAGLRVGLIQEGTPRPLSSGVTLSAHRIVQEALTNALKHAGPATVHVVLTYSDGALEVRVEDDGRGPAPADVSDDRLGHGLVGMRERAALVGGELATGPRPGGGFRVRAILPTAVRG